MAAKSSPFGRRLKVLAKEIPEERHIRGVLRLIETRHVGSDYVVAIIGASMIDRALEAAIVSRFVALNKDDRNRLFEQTRTIGRFGTAEPYSDGAGLVWHINIRRRGQDQSRSKHVCSLGVVARIRCASNRSSLFQI
jgi:hypothetical protein